MSTQRAQQAQQRRIQLIDTALSLFAERGWAAVSIPDLAQAAGVSQGLLYHYFRDKEELLQAVLERHSFLPQLRQLLLTEPIERKGGEMLLELAFRFADLLEQKRHIVRIFMQEGATHPEIMTIWRSVVEQSVAVLSDYIRACIVAGDFREHNASITARSLLYTIFMLHLTNVASQEFLPDYIHLLLSGLLIEERAR
jgi:TetR/AcrR family transcriptional regulator, cholesterol catabolism regulator